MSFIKKLFFWTKSDNIRDSDIKCCTSPTLQFSFRFPRRDFYISTKNKPKEYHDKSCSTCDLSVDSSVQCEIYNAPIWHKKPNKNNTKSILTKSESKQSIECGVDTNILDAPSIKIELNFPEKPKKLRTNQEVDFSGIPQKLIKKNTQQKQFTGFIFDDKTTHIFNKEVEEPDVPKIKLIRESNNHTPQVHHKNSTEKFKNKDSDNAFNQIFAKSNDDEDAYSKLFSDLDLPKPKGRFIFDDDSNEA